MPETPVDLDAYCARIGYSGPRTPTLATLRALSAAHTQAIPFENLDVLLGRGISLEPAAIVKKLIQDRRGGYCFEQNGLLLLVLGELGFRAAPLSARVRWGHPRDFTPPRTHLFIRAELEGESWLVDVGVGGLSLTSPIRLVPDEEQLTMHEPRRIVREGSRWFHQVRLGSDWQDVCEFTLEEMPPIDRELGNWFTSAHPRSHFRSHVFVARATPDGRVSLFDRDFTIRDRTGHADTRKLASPHELLAVLSERFGLEFPEGTQFSCSGLDWTV